MVFCRGCGREIHDTAPICPHCGAPQAESNQVKNGSFGLAITSIVSAILSAVIFMPITLLIAFTGDIYFEKEGQLQTVPKQSKYVLLGIFLILVAIRTMR